PKTSGVSLPDPISWFRIANNAEASSTILLTPRLFPAFGNQFIDERCARSHVFSHQLLRCLNAALQGDNSQSIVFQAQQNLISCVNAKRLPKAGGNDPSAFLTHAQASLRFQAVVPVPLVLTRRA